MGWLHLLLLLGPSLLESQQFLFHWSYYLGGAHAPIGEGVLASIDGPPGYYKNIRLVLTLDSETVVEMLEGLLEELLVDLGSHL